MATNVGISYIQRAWAFVVRATEDTSHSIMNPARDHEQDLTEEFISVFLFFSRGAPPV